MLFKIKPDYSMLLLTASLTLKYLHNLKYPFWICFGSGMSERTWTIVSLNAHLP